jgi:hypothetical protein
VAGQATEDCIKTIKKNLVDIEKTVDSRVTLDKALNQNKANSKTGNRQSVEAKIGNAELKTAWTQDKADIILTLKEEEIKGRVKNISL